MTYAVLAPKRINNQGYLGIAKMITEHGHELDWNSGGNSFKAQSFIEWANILKVRAEQLANPESFADE